MITSFFKPKKRKAKEAASTSTPETATAVSPKEISSDSVKPGEDLSTDRLVITSSYSSSADSGGSPSCSSNNNDGPNKRSKIEDTTVLELLRFLKQSEDGGTSVDSSSTWSKALDKHFQSKPFYTLARFVANQRKSATVYPPPEDVFSALTLTPFDQVKVVIVGQDPYHGPNQGHGLCFSVRKGVEIPPSLKNIYKELKNDHHLDFPRHGKMPTHGYLERWARQGVLLLNAVLTVRRGEANSHKKKGWEDVTDAILKALAQDRRKSGKGLVYLLWGKPASQKIESVLGQHNQNQIIISTSHPSPLGATKTSSPFLGSKCFSRANEALKDMGLEPIDWNVDGDLVDV